jgi:hypothetical protein
VLCGALIFVPGAQSVRIFIRAFPFAAGLVALAASIRRRSGPLTPSGPWLLASFVLLAIGLLNPSTHFKAGLGQVIFQISIGAPLFWMAATVRGPKRLARVLWILFAASAVSSVVGVLQVYYPDTFLPPEFSDLGRQLNPTFVSDLSYIGADGRAIVRPPGLSDIPGGAAVTGLMTVLLGIGYIGQKHTGRLRRIGAVGAIAVGMTALYLTQVRALTVVTVIGVAISIAVRVRQGRVLQGGWIAVVSVVLLGASFLWATTVGGDAVRDRFSGLVAAGVFPTYMTARGAFLDYTLRDLMFQFPLGAGLGRWGMMNIYFPEPSMWNAQPIWAEIQITGWLLDGGVLMWVFYGGALASACRHSYAIAVRGPRHSVQDLASVVLALQLAIVGLCLTAPVFNTVLGVIFWTATGALYGATLPHPMTKRQSALVNIAPMGLSYQAKNVLRVR